MARSDRARDFRWRFHRLGGFDQVRIETGADVCHLAELDQKLWAALSCPTTGLELDTHTLALLDTDEDGRIRVPEILAAADWTCRALKNPDDLVKGESVLPLSVINTETDEGRRVLESARNILANLGKPDAVVITAEDTADTGKIFATARFNGDGVVPPASATDPEIARAIADIITCVGSVTDRSGAQGISPELCEHFFTERAPIPIGGPRPRRIPPICSRSARRPNRRGTPSMPSRPRSTTSSPGPDSPSTTATRPAP